MKRQELVLKWAVNTFGPDATKRRVRAAMLLEEAIEVAQVEGLRADDVERILHRVYSKPPGEIGQEIGGVALCLEGLAQNAGLDVEAEAEREWQRIQALPSAVFQEKHADKIRVGAAGL